MIIAENLLDSRTLLVGGNANTVYWYIPLDTTGGPLVVKVPPQELGLINDTWSRWVEDVGVTGPDQGHGGKYLLLPPGYTGAVPDGYFVVRPATYNLFVFFRSFIVDGDPRPGVEIGKARLRVYPLAQADDPPEPRFVNFSGKTFNTIGPSDYTAFEYINQVIQEEPTEATDANTLGLLASIGIKKGQPFAPDARMKAILEEAARAGDATARALAYRYRDPPAYYYPHSAWRMLYHGGYRLERDGARLWDSYISLFFYGWGLSPAMDGQMVGKGSQYALAFVDAQGEPLDGGKTYRLHLPPNIPVVDFWSVTLYDAQTRSMLQTDQEVPIVSSQTPGLQVNADTSVDVYFGPEPPPAGKEHNWVQMIPGKGWWIGLRLYGPLEPWFDKTWRPGEIEPVA